jgi:hypothetical protein
MDKQYREKWDCGVVKQYTDAAIIGLNKINLQQA